MRHVLTISKYITLNYYGDPVDHATMSLSVSEELSPAEIEVCKDNVRRELDHLPVESFPVAGAHASLLAAYEKRHPDIARKFKL